MLTGLALRHDTLGVALVGCGQFLDVLWHGGREHQRALVGGCGTKNEFKIVLKPEIEHLVSLVQNDGTQHTGIKGAALDMVAQPARRADHDRGTAF